MGNLSCERYEADIIDTLDGYAKEGRGKLVELATVQVGERQLPFVAFTTGPQVVVTARHHIGEFWGTTEAVMKLAKSRQEGLTLVPVVDVEYYAWAEKRRESYLEDDGYGCAAMYMWDMFKGYKGWPSYARNDWKDYKYTWDDSPPHIAAIKRLIDKCSLFIDLHNSAVDGYFFLTMPTGMSFEADIITSVSTEMERINQPLTAWVSSSIVGRRLSSGVFEYRGGSHQTSIDYAATLGRINLAFELPVFSGQPVPAGGWPQLSDPEQLADITAGAISNITKFVRSV